MCARKFGRRAARASPPSARPPPRQQPRPRQQPTAGCARAARTNQWGEPMALAAASPAAAPARAVVLTNRRLAPPAEPRAPPPRAITAAQYYAAQPLYRLGPDGRVVVQHGAPARHASAPHARVPVAAAGGGASSGPTAAPERLPVRFKVPQYVTRWARAPAARPARSTRGALRRLPARGTAGCWQQQPAGGLPLVCLLFLLAAAAACEGAQRTPLPLRRPWPPPLPCTSFGEFLKVVGSAAELGAWDAAKVRLATLPCPAGRLVWLLDAPAIPVPLPASCRAGLLGACPLPAPLPVAGHTLLMLLQAA
jgi:hypothetical protein